MASIRKYKTASGTAWRVQYRSPDGRSRTKQGFPTKAKAESWAAANTTQIDAGAWIDPNAGKVTVRQLSELWWAGRQHLKPSTLHRDRARLEHVLEEWGERQAASIRPSEVQGWVSGLTKAAATVRHFHSILSQVLDVAVQDRLIAANPARGVKLPKKGKPVKVYLTPEQVGLLAASCSREDDARIVWLLSTAGLRWGELAGLHVGDVDFERSTINISRNAVLSGSRIDVVSPKTPEARTVAVSLPVMMMSRDQIEGRHSGAVLFADEVGGYRRPPKSPKGWFDSAVRRAQAEDFTFPHVTPHGLRHVAAGLMVSAGANVKVVQRQLGHASAAMTLDTYAELFDNDLLSVADVVGERISSVVGLWFASGVRA